MPRKITTKLFRATTGRLTRSFMCPSSLNQRWLSATSRAVDLWPEFTLAHFGLAQMYLAKGETAKAIASFEVVIKKHPDNYETLKILASLYAQTGKRDKAIHNFRRITEVKPRGEEPPAANDITETFFHDRHTLRIQKLGLSWVIWLNGRNIIPRHSKRMKKPLSFFKHKGNQYQLKYGAMIHSYSRDYTKLEVQLWNNVGVLRHQIGDLERAEEAYRLALAASGATEQEFKAQDITTLYNLGRLYEAQHRYDFGCARILTLAECTCPHLP